MGFPYMADTNRFSFYISKFNIHYGAIADLCRNFAALDSDFDKKANKGTSKKNTMEVK